MNNLVEFKPIVPNKKEEMLTYYRDNNIPIPDVPYFRETYDITPEEIMTEKPKEPISTIPSKPVYISKSEIPKVDKLDPILEKFKDKTDNKSSFFKNFWTSAKKASEKTGIPAETLLAMSALETGYGKSMPGNMVAGVKANKGYKGKFQDLETTEYVGGKPIKIKSKFRAYDSPEEGFEDFGNFLKNNPRYKKALGEKDPLKALKEIADAGYATSPNYYNIVSSIINDIIT